MSAVNCKGREITANSAAQQELNGSFQRQFLVVSHLLLAVGLISLFLADGQMLYVAVGLAACLLSAWRGWLGRELLPRRWSHLLAVLAALWAVVDVFFVSRSVLFGLSHTLVFLQAVKLLQRKTAADYRTLYLVSFVQLVLAAAVTVSVLFAVVLPAYLVVATWALILLHLRVELERGEAMSRGVRMVVPGGPPLRRRFFVGSTIVAVGIFGAGLAIFLALPRVSLGLMSLRSPLAVVLSGFSSSVKLGDLGRMLLNPQVVMRVEFPEPVCQLDGDILWRGVALDQYTGRGWRVGSPANSFVRRSADGLFHLPYVADVPKMALLRQEIVVEGIDSPVLFAAFRPAKLDGKFRWIRSDANGALSGVLSQRGGVRYTVWSIMPGAASKLRGLPRPLRADEEARYLQLPPLSPRLRELAQGIVQGAADESSAANRLADYLRTEYAYSLEVRPASGSDPVEDFLFRRRAGHCEYFASAMAIMLRAVGIPSRVVNGFRGAEWNAFGDYYVVRERNAHSWVEAYLTGQGWVTFDPTPASRSTAAGLPGFLGSLSQFVDTFRWRWHRHVIDFDTTSQQLLGRRSLRYVAWWRSRVSGWRDGLAAIREGAVGPEAPGLWVGAGALCTALVVLLSRRRAPSGSRFGKGDAKAGAGFYDALLKLLARWGYVRQACCTPRELARLVVAQEGDEVRVVEEVTEMYYRVRYGGHRLAVEEYRRVIELLRRLEDLKGGGAGRREQCTVASGS